LTIVAGLIGADAQIVVETVPGASVGAVADPAKRIGITGPCRVGWREGLARVAASLYPDRVRGALGGADRILDA
jgi:hypothetical protein